MENLDFTTKKTNVQFKRIAGSFKKMSELPKMMTAKVAGLERGGTRLESKDADGMLNHRTSIGTNLNAEMLSHPDVVTC